MSNYSLYRVNLTGAGKPIASLNTFTSEPVSLRSVDAVQAILIRVNAAGSPDVKVEFEATPDGTTWIPAGNQPPIIASTATAFVSKPDPKGWQTVDWPLTLLPSKTIRMKFSGINANPSDTVIDAKLLLKELHGLSV